jgi:hypothetical protein
LSYAPCRQQPFILWPGLLQSFLWPGGLAESETARDKKRLSPCLQHV